MAGLLEVTIRIGTEATEFEGVEVQQGDNAATMWTDRNATGGYLSLAARL